MCLKGILIFTDEFKRSVESAKIYVQHVFYELIYHMTYEKYLHNKLIGVNGVGTHINFYWSLVSI